MRFLNDTVIATQSIAGDVQSAAIDASQMVYATAQIVSTSTAAGTLKLQGSNDFKNPTNWNDIPNATASVSSAGAVTIPVTQTCFKWIRVTYTHTSGSGNGTVVLQAQTF